MKLIILMTQLVPNNGKMLFRYFCEISLQPYLERVERLVLLEGPELDGPVDGGGKEQV